MVLEGEEEVAVRKESSFLINDLKVVVTTKTGEEVALKIPYAATVERYCDPSTGQWSSWMAKVSEVEEPIYVPKYIVEKELMNA